MNTVLAGILYMVNSYLCRLIKLRTRNYLMAKKRGGTDSEMLSTMIIRGDAEKKATDIIVSVRLKTS